MTTYQAILIDDQIKEGRISGEIFFEADSIYFKSGNITRSIPLHELKMSLGGTGNRVIYFNGSYTQFSLSTSDKNILNEPSLKAQNNLQSASANIRKQAKYINLSIFAFVALCLLALSGLFYFKDNIVRSIADNIPYSMEQKLGEQYISQLKFTGQLDTSSLALKQFEEKANLIFKNIKNDYAFKLCISKSEDINAYALPGGYIVFNKGLLNSAKNWEEVLGVLGHEAAHVTEKHHTRGIVSQFGWTTLLSMMFGDGSALTSLIFGASAQLEQLSYSRNFEKESDEKGFQYLVKSKVNPVGLKTFFETLSKEQGIASKIPELLSTHPSSDNRVGEIQKLIDSKNKTEYIQLGDYSQFKSMIKQDTTLLK
jgi:beta-barrel assembly-enhancing protease